MKPPTSTAPGLHTRGAFGALLRQGLLSASKRRTAMIVLYALPVLWGIVFSFMVYLKYAGSANPLFGEERSAGGTIVMSLMERAIKVRSQIDVFFNVSRLFVLLVVGWFGAGLIADDRCSGVYQLHFSRPMGWRTYFAARATTLLLLGGAAVVVPGLMICTTAAFSSPDFSFITEEGTAILATLGYAAVLTLLYASVALAASALASRRSFALMLLFGTILLPDILSRIFWGLSRNTDWRVLSPLTSMRRIGAWMLDRNEWFDWPVWWSVLYIGGIVLAATIAAALRVRRMEREP